MVRMLFSLVLIAGLTSPLFAIDDYVLGPDSMVKEGVPKGKIVEGIWKSDKIYPGTERKYLVYTPAQYDGKTPAALMVFQDGEAYAKLDGGFRAPTVFDNLIAAKEMPVTIGIFLNPAIFPPPTKMPSPQQPELRVRFTRRSVCEVPHRRSAAGTRGEARVGDHRRPGSAGGVRDQFRRHLRVDRRLERPIRSAKC